MQAADIHAYVIQHSHLCKTEARIIGVDANHRTVEITDYILESYAHRALEACRTASRDHQQILLGWKLRLSGLGGYRLSALEHCIHELKELCRDCFTSADEYSGLILSGECISPDDYHRQKEKLAPFLYGAYGPTFNLSRTLQIGQLTFERDPS